jgi:hypothetical protein
VLQDPVVEALFQGLNGRVPGYPLSELCFCLWAEWGR